MPAVKPAGRLVIVSQQYPSRRGAEPVAEAGPPVAAIGPANGAGTASMTSTPGDAAVAGSAASYLYSTGPGKRAI